MTEMTTYKYWKSVPEGVKTKTQWLKDGYNVHQTAEPIAIFKGQYDNYNLYGIDQVSAKKRIVKQIAPVSLALTPENIGKCLHIINKAAKRRRDSTEDAYFKGHHGRAAKNKQEKNKFYILKDRVLEHAKTKNHLVHEGFHSQKMKQALETIYHDDSCCCEDCLEFLYGAKERGFKYKNISKKSRLYFECVALGDFRFHKPCDRPQDVEILDLGKWTSEAAPYDKTIRLCDCEQTLYDYLRS